MIDQGDEAREEGHTLEKLHETINRLQNGVEHFNPKHNNPLLPFQILIATLQFERVSLPLYYTISERLSWAHQL